MIRYNVSNEKRTLSYIAGIKGEKGDDAPKITGVQQNADYTLTFNLSDGTSYTIPNSVRGEKGEKGDKGDSFTYDDFTPEQLANLKGAKGDKGDVGERGPKGDKGDTGERGPMGLKGDTGARGPQGQRGEKGDAFTYSDFTQEQLTALTGPQGQQGEQGPQGLKGDKGDTGEQGIQGETGPKGDKGDKGDTGETGAQGPKGDTGPQGEQGIQGIQGVKGERGNSIWHSELEGSFVWIDDMPYYSFILGRLEDYDGSNPPNKGDTLIELDAPCYMYTVAYCDDYNCYCNYHRTALRGHDGNRFWYSSTSPRTGDDSYVFGKDQIVDYSEETPPVANDVVIERGIDSYLYVITEVGYEELTCSSVRTPLRGTTGPQGPQGEQGIQGIQGEDGEAGYTPVKGTDYFTQSDVEGIENDLKAYIDTYIGPIVDGILS